MVDVKEKIQKLTNDRNWTTYQLAEYSGLSQSTISSIFSLNRQPTIDTLCRICKAFNITLSEFFYENNESDVSIFSAKYARLEEKDKAVINYLLDRFN